MAEAQSAVEQPSGDSPDLDALIEAKFGGFEERSREQTDEPQEPEAQTGEEATEPEAEAQPEFVEVEYAGTKYQVPPELKEALMYQADYTAKTTEAARLRDNLSIQQKELALFQEQRLFEQSVAQDVDRLKMIDAYINMEDQALGQNWAQMTREQRQDKQFELQRLEKQRAELAKALQAKHSEFNEKINGERSKLKESAKEVLAKAIPGYSDELHSQVQKYAQSLGYPEVAVQNMSALDAQIAWESMQYRKIKAETKTAVKKAADAPVIAPTARKAPMPKQVRAKFDLKNAVKTGDRAKVASAVDKRLEQLFGG